MTSLSTHVLDAVDGTPARGLRVRLSTGAGVHVSTADTDDDGRVASLSSDLTPADYRLAFHTGEWFARRGIETFYPTVQIHFSITGAQDHYHVPILLSPYSYATYRGS